MLATLLLLGSVMISTSDVQAAIRMAIPNESPGVPAYARTDLPFGLHTEEWAAIVFYRAPSCVPRDFNLLEFFDFTPDDAFGLRVFGCPLTVSGFEVWENGPEDGAPLSSHLRGLGAVPIWFVSWPLLREIINVDDPVLTIADLEDLNPLVGLASFFEEELHPTFGAQHPHYSLVARGQLENERSFQIQAVFNFDASVGGDRARSVQIRFK